MSATNPSRQVTSTLAEPPLYNSTNRVLSIAPIGFGSRQSILISPVHSVSTAVSLHFALKRVPICQKAERELRLQLADENAPKADPITRRHTPQSPTPSQTGHPPPLQQWPSHVASSKKLND
jgi:hypothetical protein